MKNIIGIIPAAGHGTRLGPLPCSKEIFPIGFTKTENGLIPKPIALYLIERMINAGTKKIFIVISKGKWDIPDYLGNGSKFGASITYLIQEKIHGMPFALDLATPWIKNETILFGMPDSIFTPFNAFSQLLNYHNSIEADLTLGAFPTDNPQRFGMIDFDSNATLTDSIDKPQKTYLEYMWGVACWNKRFNDFLHTKIKELSNIESELILGKFFQLAKIAGLRVKVFPFRSGKYIDIGCSKRLATTLETYPESSKWYNGE